jgi:hypothetical protein
MLLNHPSDPDIFITMPPPTSRSASPPPTAAHEQDNLDDVWGSDSIPSSQSLLPSHIPSSHQHPSDIPRLQQEHATAGYRDGVTAAKAASAQAGFDEGFGLGAVIGARAGRVLGVLEGLALAVRDERTEKLWRDARRELGVVSIFGAEYWDGEGVWRFEVGNQGRGEEDIVFADVAGAHPLVMKWEGVVKDEARRWNVDLEMLSGEDGVVRTGEEVGVKSEGVKTVGSVKEKKALDW